MKLLGVQISNKTGYETNWDGMEREIKDELHKWKNKTPNYN